jgi:hypothetical protein
MTNSKKQYVAVVLELSQSQTEDGNEHKHSTRSGFYYSAR